MKPPDEPDQKVNEAINWNFVLQMSTFLHIFPKKKKKRMRGALWPSKPFIKSIKLIIRQAHDVKNFPLQLFLSPSLIIFHICSYLPFLLSIRIIRLGLIWVTNGWWHQNRNGFQLLSCTMLVERKSKQTVIDDRHWIDVMTH